MALRAVALIGGPAAGAGRAALSAGRRASRCRATTFLGFELALYRPDSLSLIFGFGFVLAAALGGIYSLHRRDRMQDAAGLVYAGSALAAVFAGDLVSLVIFAELATLASAVLVFARRTRPAYRAGLRYLVIQIDRRPRCCSAGVALYGVGEGDLPARRSRRPAGTACWSAYSISTSRARC